jgi:sugar lactone lactonase YvrE
MKRELPANIYRVDRNGHIEIAATQDALASTPNGIAFAPDFKKVYVVAHGGVVVGAVTADNRIANSPSPKNPVVSAISQATSGGFE